MKFKDLYESLNDSQRKAVNAIEGTVMVVAGPGTGKTQVLGARIANILEKTDCAPDSILCLTFTEAATVALRNRLFHFIGSIAHRIPIYTYHGFCNSIIQDNKEILGIQDLEPLSDLERIQVLREIIEELPAEHALKRFTGDTYFDLSNLNALFNLMKKEHFEVRDIEVKIESYITGISNSEEFRLQRNSKSGKKGDFKKTYHAELEKMDKLAAAVRLFDTYTAKLKAIRRYDFNDMILWVLRLFDEHPDVLLITQEKYQYFLVDEYQDTNGAQNDLLMQLINYWDNPNVFVVGDDDQSIYKFQGANVENITSFYEKFKDHLHLVSLTQNYRSSQEIIDTASSVIQHNTERLISQIPGMNKDITASNENYANLKQSLFISTYPNPYQEIVGISQKVKSLTKDGVPLREIAVLYRKHAQSAELINYLLAENIPFSVSNDKNLFEVPLIRQLILLLKYLDRESRSMDSAQEMLFEILHFSNFTYARPTDISILSNQLSRDKSKGWREQLHSTNAEELEMEHSAAIEIKRFISDIDYWISQLYNKTTQTLVEEVLSKCGFVGRALKGSDPMFEMQCLHSFYTFLKQETAKDPGLSLEQFLQIMALMESHNIPLVLKKVIHGENGIQLMSVHGSKGLEFDYVFLMGCDSSAWEYNHSRLPFNMSRIIAGDSHQAAEEEGRRLFYVALTRARKGLELSYSEKDENDKSRSKSAFLVEASESEHSQNQHVELDHSVILSFFQKSLLDSSKRYQDLSQLDFVKNEIERFRLSATNLNSYLKCPIAFFYQNIIRVPSAKNEAMTFGSAIHYTLDSIFKYKADSGGFPNIKFSLGKFEYFLQRHRESFTEEAFLRRMEYAQLILPRYLSSRKEQWLPEENVETEVGFKNLEFEGIPIRGQIDKIVRKVNQLTVVDYKTGKYDNAKNKMDPPLPSDKLKETERDHNKIKGGDYWRQLYFYKIMLDSDRHFEEEVVSGILDFVEPVNGEFPLEVLHFSHEEEEMVKSQLREVYHKIKNAEFSIGCDKEDCEWCNFNKYYLHENHSVSKDLLKADVDEMEER